MSELTLQDVAQGINLQMVNEKDLLPLECWKRASSTKSSLLEFEDCTDEDITKFKVRIDILEEETEANFRVRVQKLEKWHKKRGAR